MSKAFEAIDRLKSEWDTLQPLALENERRLWQKLRLEWNYHSNHIEGNTLTYGETALLLLHGQTHGDHSIREYEEMKAHDMGIEHLRFLAADRARLIGETDIRDLNRIILKEPFWKPTRTTEGQPTRSKVFPGEYKTLPNSVITATGELFEYARPIDVPARMQAVVEWLATSLGERSLHLLQIAAKLHHDFVLIHPFDDGNGRVSRMLVNYLLLREGYPPLIVPTGEKNSYLTSLRLADAGDLGPLSEFLGTQLERSLKLAIKAAKGESIEEPSDVEKQVALFVRGEQARKKELGLPTGEVLGQLAETSFYPFIAELERKLDGLKPLFSKCNVVTENLRGARAFGAGVSRQEIEFQIPGGQILMSFRFLGYRGESSTPFDHTSVVGIHFPPGKYTITQDGNVLVSKPYTEPILNEEIDQITARILAKIFGVIRGKASPRE
ncbi:Fic family protein [Luteolibacter sp. Populi]|uniref:Fic family protein n=1 Tax=Luteolibacter sp. Populi TaxID=3230487 RepID=UPI0034662C45